jgi:hypothetical protein
MASKHIRSINPVPSWWRILRLRALTRSADMKRLPASSQGDTAPMAVSRSKVIQAMLKRLAEEELQEKRERAEGSVGTTRPSQARAAEA